MTVDDFISNPTDNRPFEDVLASRVSRRGVMAGGLAGAAGFLATTGVAGAIEEETKGKDPKAEPKTEPKVEEPAPEEPKAESALVGFTPVPVEDGNGPWPAISEDYEWAVLQSWGDPINPKKGPAFQWPPKSAADQEQQVGIGHDGMWLFPMYKPAKKGGGMSRRALLCINHEFGRTSHVLGKDAPESLEETKIMQAAHGCSVLVLKQRKGGKMWGKNGHKGPWKMVPGKKARRITVNTPVEFSGPVADTEYLENKAKNPYLGTVNNCANGYTPWGTYLTCEENFNGYFGDATYDADTETGQWEADEAQERYGFAPTGFGYGWEDYDPRFDLNNPDYANEHNRFGWIVEIDPYRPKKKPVKRTALGRFKHEGIALTIGKDGRAVGYMGDDQRFDYIYKFVSAGNYQEMLSKGQSPLDEGTLYVARFNDDGSGDWLELSMDNPEIAAVFKDQAEVLVKARLAADIVGATPMDRPEWTSVGPDGTVWCTLTNNSRREPDDVNAANPLGPNDDGHIIRWEDSDDHVGTTFNWDIWIFAQDTHGTEESFSDPDGLWVDPDGRVIIQTDGGQADGLNNQCLVADPYTGDIKRLFTGVTDDEITGIAISPDRKTLFINTQHPGNGDPEATNFPAMPDGVTVPRDSTIMLWRKDGGIVGS